MKSKMRTAADKDKELLTVNVDQPKTTEGQEEAGEETKQEEKDGDTGKTPMTEETIDDRVFVCLGKSNDGLNRK